jgi:hypothetical protein
VFRRRGGRERCVAIANYEADRAIAVDVTLDGSGAVGRYRPVDDDVWRPVAGAIPIPPRSAIVVLEQ